MADSDDEIELLLAFKIGADDYIVRPYRRRELVARVEAAHRRHTGVCLYCEGSGAADCPDPAALTTYEQPYFSKAVGLIAESVPDAGHDLALSPTADVSIAEIGAWLNGQVTVTR